MCRPCVNISEDNACVLDGETCAADCPLFESEADVSEWRKQNFYKFWDHQVSRTNMQDKEQ